MQTEAGALLIEPIREWLKITTFQTELSPAPEFRGITLFREFSENSTEFLCYFQNWLNTLQKASE